MLPKSPQRLSNLVANSNYSYFRVLGPKCQNMEIRPQNPGFSETFDSYQIVRIVLLICFQRALNDFPILSQTLIIPIFVFWAQNAQIWKFAHTPQIFIFFWKLSNCWNRLTNVLPMRYQWLVYRLYNKSYTILSLFEIFSFVPLMVFWKYECPLHVYSTP